MYMLLNNITIGKILGIKGGSLEDLQQYAQTKGICLPSNLDYCLSRTEQNAIAPTLAYRQETSYNFRAGIKTCLGLTQDEKTIVKTANVNAKNVHSKNKEKKSNRFIGVIKFFDKNKDFGFIASNNCNMPTIKYNQNFYVNSFSFVEAEAMKEGTIVVFQIEKQANGKKKAINIRKISQSDEDIKLALSYYGDHEYVEYKDGKKINLYTHLYKPLKLVAEKVQNIIERDTKRSPENTIKHFRFFVEHYKIVKNLKQRFIFDRQFYTEEKCIWEKILSIFSYEEQLAALKLYPSIVKYFNEEKLIQQWIKEFLTDKCTLSDLQILTDSFDFIPQKCVESAKKQIEILSDKRIKELYRELSKRSDIYEEDFSSYVDVELSVLGVTDNREKQLIIEKLCSYLKFSDKSYDKEKELCIASNKENRFNQKLNNFIVQPANKYARDEFFKYLKNLSNEELQGFHKDKIKEKVSMLLDRYINERSYYDATYVIKQLQKYNYEFLTSYITKLYPLIKVYLSEILRKNIDSAYVLEHNFFSSYISLTSIYGKEDCLTLKRHLVSILIETKSIDVLSLASDLSHEWLSIDDALLLAKQQILTWNYNQLREFVSDEPKLFNDDIRFANIVIEKSCQLIERIPLSLCFDRTPFDDIQNKTYLHRFPERENCSFLNNLKKFIPKDQQNSLWNNYVKSRDFDDLITMFENEVIVSLPESVIEKIINSIDLNSVYANDSRWYYKPVLQNKTYEKILKTTSADIFSMISKRILTLDVSRDNISLVVLLTELMSINKPNSGNYQILKNWEQHFCLQLTDFKNTISSSSPNLSAILWAVYFRTATSMTALSDIFAFLPPYVQIRCVKKLFQLIAQRRIKHSAESLYNLITKGGNRICLPLEVTFAYLKSREKNPLNTLDNRIMLKLLNDREDHAEWIGIRQLVTECYGRWLPVELADDSSNWKRNKYINGIIYKEQNKILKVFVPNRMIDQYGSLTDYNNKYFNQIKELINITYTNGEYQSERTPQGVSYYFDEKYELELFAIARSFNLEYKGLGNELDFEKKEDEADVFCECRLANKVDNSFGLSFYWCGNKPCFRTPIRYMLDDEWEHYTILDFMRILQIPTDYCNKSGKITKFGHYIILSSYLKYFRKFYEHLKCRKCGNLMKPTSGITNFTTHAVNQFSCINKQCESCGKVVYLNHCFNKQKCNATIDSRDSKTCPNNQYICPECGACCSTEIFRLRINNLNMTGGYISPGIINFVQNNLGHWEKKHFFCYKCGKQMELQSDGYYICKECDTKYKSY